jgi:hypothetical protein
MIGSGILLLPLLWLDIVLLLALIIWLVTSITVAALVTVN